MNNLTNIYKRLLGEYGQQGWWPLIELHKSSKGSNPTKTGSVNGYHPGDYSFPKDEQQKFEICLGAILTQNTSWPNVEKALNNLRKRDALTLKGIKKLSDGKLRECIKIAGYFNQKSRYIREFIGFFESLGGKPPQREDLLAVKGIGPETCDSILLYAFKVPVFVIDAYTRRIFSRLGFLKEKEPYDRWQNLFMDALKDEKNKVELFQEYHALIVELAKRCCMKKPECSGCVLKELCPGKALH